MKYTLQVSREFYKYLYGLFPAEMTWEETLKDLLNKAGMPPPDKKLCLSDIRKICQHPNPVIKTGLLPNPEEKWRYCPNCELLIELIKED